MTIYIINIILIGIYSFIYNFIKKTPKTKMFFITISIIQLILLQTFRDVNLGVDMPVYWKYVSEQLYMSFQELNNNRFEIGYKFLTKIITMMTDNKQIYLFVISCISTIPLGIISNKYSKMPFFTIFLFLSFGFYNFNFSGIRQAMAFGMTVLSYKYIQEKNIIKYMLIIFIATMFHSSAIVFLPAYFIGNITLTKIKLSIIVFINALIFVFKNQIFNIINQVFYDDYTIVETDSYLWMIMCISIVFACLMLYKMVVKNNNKSKGLYVYTLIGASLMLFAPIANNVMRIANYYFMFIILLIPEVVEKVKKEDSKYVINFVICMFAILLYLYMLKTDGYNIVPYKFFWDS